MKKKPGRGRPPVEYVDDAIEMILASKEPVSTRELIDKLDLTEHEGIHLRRGLKRSEERGQIQRVIPHPDGSFTWLPKEVSVESCAGHAANLFLRRKKADLQIDPDKFENWVLNEGQLQS
jgi:hypothetical protein